MFLLCNHTSDGIVQYTFNLFASKKSRNKFFLFMHMLVL